MDLESQKYTYKNTNGIFLYIYENKERLDKCQTRVNTEIEYCGRDMLYRGKGMILTCMYIFLCVSGLHSDIYLRQYEANVKYFEYIY